MGCVDDCQNLNVQKEPKTKSFLGEKKEACVIVAEDDYEMRRLLALELLRAGYEVVECPDGWSLLEHLESYILTGSKNDKIDLVISDIRMPGITGLEILRGLPQGHGYPPIILITAFGDEKTHHQAEALGVVAMFDKPFAIDDLLTKVREIVPL